MRELTGHKVNPANDVLRVLVFDEPGPGGAHHAYRIEGYNYTKNPACSAWIVPGDRVDGVTLLFQNGPINEVGVNGLTHEALIVILIDRLTCFQQGPYANEFNERALESLMNAQDALLERTRRRMAQGIEGTMALDPPKPSQDPIQGGNIMPTGKSGNPIMKHFAFEHLPPHLRDTSMKFGALAKVLEFEVPNGPEKSAGLRKLLEAKDCFVRAVLP